MNEFIVQNIVEIINHYDVIKKWQIKISRIDSITISNKSNIYTTNSVNSGMRYKYRGVFLKSNGTSFVINGDSLNEYIFKESLEMGIEADSDGDFYKESEFETYTDVNLVSNDIKNIVLNKDYYKLINYMKNMENINEDFHGYIELTTKIQFIQTYYIKRDKMFQYDETKENTFVSIYLNDMSWNKLISSRKLDTTAVILRNYLEQYTEREIKKVPYDIKDIKTTLITASAFTKLLDNIFINNINANEIIQDRVYLKETMLDTKILGDFTIIDNGIAELEIGSIMFDNEGTPSKKTIIFEDGYFKTPLITKKSESHFADKGLKVTGNALNGNNVDITNMYIYYKDASDIVVKGLYIKVHKLKGYNFNKLTGDFNLEANFTEVYIGDDLIDIKDFIISGNLFDIMNSKTTKATLSKRVDNYVLPDLLTDKVKIICNIV